MIIGMVCPFLVSGMSARNRWTARSFFHSTQVPFQGGVLSGQVQ
jgi:hypothetical protein